MSIFIWQVEWDFFPGSCSPQFCVSQELGFRVPRDVSVSLSQKSLALFPREVSFSRLPRKYLHALLIQERNRMAFREFHHIDENSEVWVRISLCDPSI